MHRDAERQFRSSLQAQPAVTTYLELVNVYLRLDVPNTALDLLGEAWWVSALLALLALLAMRCLCLCPCPCASLGVLPPLLLLLFSCINPHTQHHTFTRTHHHLSERFPLEPRLLLAQARIHDQLHASDTALALYR